MSSKFPVNLPFKLKHTVGVFLAILITHAHAQRSVFEQRIDLRTAEERAEDQRLELLRLQRVANEELRRQTRTMEDAAFRATIEELRRANAEADAGEQNRKILAAELHQLRRDLQPKERHASGTDYSPPPKASIASPPQSNNPNEFPTFLQFKAAHNDEDNLSVVRKYRDEVRLHLLKKREYDDELVDEIDALLFQQAVEQGWLAPDSKVKAMSQLFGSTSNSEALDAGMVYRQSFDNGDTSAREAAIAYKSLLSEEIRRIYVDRSEYDAALERAKRQFRSIATHDKIAAARRAAVERGDVPFAVVDGRLHLGKEIKKCAGDDVALATIFEKNPTLDRNLIGAVRKELQRP